MAFRPLKSFFSTADELLRQDLATLGGVLLSHLKSYEGLSTVYQHAGLNRSYFRAMLENRNVGLWAVTQGAGIRGASTCGDDPDDGGVELAGEAGPPNSQ